VRPVLMSADLCGDDIMESGEGTCLGIYIYSIS
jgi:hypothetical protein